MDTGAAVALAKTAARAVKTALARYVKPCSFCIVRLHVPITHEAGLDASDSTAWTMLSHLLPDLEALAAEGIVVGKIHDLRYCRNAPTRRPAVWLGLLTTLNAEELTRTILDCCTHALDKRMDAEYTRTDAWRYDRPWAFAIRGFPFRGEAKRVVEGEPFAVDIESGPHSYLPDGLGEPKPLRACCRGFALPGGWKADLSRAAKSSESQDLLKILEIGLGAIFAPDAQGITAVHLAALSGDVGVAEAVVDRARACVPQGHGWQDRDGRTPLHHAALLDSAELVGPFLALCDSDARDRWGRTALELATSLGHHAAATPLAVGPRDLQQLCEQRVLRLLRGGGAQEALAAISLPEGRRLADCVPLHEYGALRRLAAEVPGSVEATTLLRSMSCMECWYADLLNRKCSPAVPGCMELLRVWEDMASFQDVDQKPDRDGVVLVWSPRNTKPPAVADRATFLERFHRRTGGVLRDMDWTNVMVIGGMVLACLTADDEEYARSFRETDVDIYVVGLSGDAFRQRVAEIASSLPLADGEDDHFLWVEDASLLRLRNDRLKGWLEVLCIEGTEEQRKRLGLEPGDTILRVEWEEEDYRSGRSTDPKEMLKVLAKRGGQGIGLQVRPRKAVARGGGQPSATLLRTPQTLTACVRGPSGRPLPNVQIVLAPYASPAHLLFTTDIDCTAMGFDGKHLLATPRAREAIRRRRNIARPEKYMVRGEWRTEARLLKYAMRGFRVVDLGLRPYTTVREDPRVSEAAAAASAAAGSRAGQQPDLEPFIRGVRDSGVHGAKLLLLASRSADLRRLLLHEVPKIRAGMDRDSLVSLVSASQVRSGREWYRMQRDARGDADSNTELGDADGNDHEEEPPSCSHAPAIDAEGNLEVDDGYGKATSRLLLVNPARLKGNRMSDGRLRGKELPLKHAISELDLESDRFEVRGWYEGIPARQLQPGFWELDPAVWCGVGDFRGAA